MNSIYFGNIDEILKYAEEIDEEINELDTWSSKHINEELQSIYNSIATDEEVNAYLFGK